MNGTRRLQPVVFGQASYSCVVTSVGRPGTRLPCRGGDSDVGAGPLSPVKAMAGDDRINEGVPAPVTIAGNQPRSGPALTRCGGRPARA